MRPLVGLFELFNGIVGVHLGSSQAGMPEQVFDGLQVGPLLQQVGSKTVAEGMGETFLSIDNCLHTCLRFFRNFLAEI